MTVLVRFLPPQLQRAYQHLRARLRDIERSPGFLDLDDDDPLVQEWRHLVTTWVDVRECHGIASRADSLELRYLCCGRPFITLLLAVMLLATVGSCAEPKIDRCLKLTEAYRNLKCQPAGVAQTHPRACETLTYRISDECGSITTPWLRW